MKFIGITVSAIVFSVLSTIYRGYIAAILWAWFISPLFAIRGISTAEAIGLAAAIGIFTHTYRRDPKDDSKTSEKVISAISYAIAYPSIALLFGWVTKQFI